MNSSTLRRLAADHASLRTTEPPPYYFFSPADATNLDDLTHLTIFLTGPQGTPYSQGVWKLWLKIPEDYPKSPPRACFKTRIWHPNVEENSGSVCVDTLKKDWEPRLTLRHVLITISCLLIQPNPDSALNATAGHLLQDDYDHFARQAKLMTSIHASIPSHLRDAAMAAKKRGEEPGVVFGEETDQRRTLKDKSGSSSSVVMKRLPQRLVTSTRSAPGPRAASMGAESTDEEDDDDDEASASKENDPSLSPNAVPVQSPRVPKLVKRPLSDLPCPTEDELDQICTSPSAQNIANNIPQSQAEASTTSATSPDSQAAGRSLRDASTNAIVATTQDEEETGRSAKRICSDEAKENARDGEAHGMPVYASTSIGKLKSAPVKAQPASVKQTSAPGSLGTGSWGGKGTKARIGLRRL